MALAPLVIALAFAQPVAAQPAAAADAPLVAWQPDAGSPAAPPATAAAPVSPDSSQAATPVAAPTPPPTETPPPPAPEGANPPDTQPVLRARPGNWGMTFIFGGLGPLSVAGLGDQPLADGLIFTEIGVRRVFKRFVLPFSFGAGITNRARPGLKPETAAGFSASIAILKGFRVWRRIAPYFGAFVHTHYIDAPGPDNWLWNVSGGPILGIEYFLADRVSLYGQGVFAVGPDITKTSLRMAARAVMAAGGQLGLTFYF